LKAPEYKQLVWMHGEIKTPPFSKRARLEAGLLLRLLQTAEKVPMPFSRPMPRIGARCHELRIHDENRTWRIGYRIDRSVIIILDNFAKKTRTTPRDVIDNCKRRIQLYDR
jgi:phage-related protein